MQIETVRDVIRGLPDRKRYIEVVTAILTVPVLLTVIYSNINTIKNGKATKAQEPQQVAQVLPQSTGLTIEIKQPTPRPQKQQAASLTYDSQKVEPSPVIKECIKSVGPSEIISPKENETLTSNPVCIDITSEKGEYCSVVWSYRINNSPWSDFTDKSICLYDLSSGNKQLEVRVRSIAGREEVVLTRNFSYQPPISPSPSVTPSSSSSAQLAQ